MPSASVPAIPDRLIPKVPPVVVTDVKPVKVGVVDDRAAGGHDDARPFVLTMTSRTLSEPTELFARTAVVEFPIVKPASVLFEPSVSAATVLVTLTAVPVGLFTAG